MLSKRYRSIFLILLLVFNVLGCFTPRARTDMYKSINISKERFCLDLPMPIMAFNDVESLIYYKIIIQDDTIYIYKEGFYSGDSKTYYVDVENKKLIRKDSVIFYSDAKKQRTERTWIEKTMGANIFYYVDNVEHERVNKISYTYEPGGRGGKKNESINFLDDYNTCIKSILMPYYGHNGSVSSINTLNDKFVIIVEDLFDHKNNFKKPITLNYSLYIFNINDLLKPCLNSTKRSKYFSLTDSIPSYIPHLDKNVIGRIID